MDEKDRIILEMRNKGRKAVHQSIYDEYIMIGDTRIYLTGVLWYSRVFI